MFCITAVSFVTKLAYCLHRILIPCRLVSVEWADHAIFFCRKKGSAGWKNKEVFGMRKICEYAHQKQPITLTELLLTRKVRLSVLLCSSAC